MNSKNSSLIAFVICTMLALIISAWCYQKPSYNWDTLPYMALILLIDEEDLSEIHKQTYSTAQAEIPENEYRLMSDTTHALRREMISDYEKFFQFSSFFRVKPLYLFFSYVAYKAGVPLSKAPVMVSVISFFLIFGMLAFWIGKKYGVFGSIISLAIILTPPVLEAGQLATPDTLSTLILLIAFYLMLEKKRWPWIVALLTVSILIRADNIFLAAIVFPVCWFNSQERPSLVLLMSIIMIWILLAAAILYFSNFQNGLENFYGGLSGRINPANAFNSIIGGLKTIQNSHLILALVICAMALFYNYKFSIHTLSEKQKLFMGLLIYVGVKFLFFPDLTTRLYLPVYIISIVLIIDEIGRISKNTSHSG